MTRNSTTMHSTVQVFSSAPGFGSILRSARHLLLAPVLVLPVAGQVLLVDAAGGGDFTTIQDAILATAPGHLIVVRSGHYPGFMASGRGFELVADGQVEIGGPIEVSQVPTADSVVLAGLALRKGFTVADASGLVILQDCSVPLDPVPVIGEGGNSYPDWGFCHAGGTRQRISNSEQVVLVNCTIRGAHGQDAQTWDGSPGHHGLVVEDSTVDLHGCTIVGGDGGNGGLGHGATTSGAGGDAVRALGAATELRLVNCTLVGGPGGLPGQHIYAGCAGVPLDVSNGAAAWSTTAPAFTSPSLVRGCAPAVIEFTAAPGSEAFLLRGTRAVREAFGLTVGVLYLGRPLRVLSFGIVPASGSLTADIGQPGPTELRGFFARHYQAMFVEAGQRRFSIPRRMWIVAATL